MLAAKEEGRWLADLDEGRMVLFLAKLGHELTVVGRNSYQPQTEALDKPAQLRRINEVLHRVLACLAQTLNGGCERSFQESIALLVLNQSDPELGALTQAAWQRTKNVCCRET